MIPPPIPPPVFRVMVFEDVSLDLPTQYPVVTLIENEPPLRSLVVPGWPRRRHGTGPGPPQNGVAPPHDP